MRPTKPLVWDAEEGHFSNAMDDEEVTASSPEDAAEQYVRGYMSQCGMGEPFEEYGGEIDHYGQGCTPAKIEVWVREYPETDDEGQCDYSNPEWKRAVVTLSATVDYHIDGAKMEDKACPA